MSDKRVIFSGRIGICRKGMTFTEVLVAAAILAFAMIPILKALSQAHLLSSSIEQRSRSLIHAQAQMEELQARALENYDAFLGQSDLAVEPEYYCTITDVSSGIDLRTVTVQAGYDQDEDLHLESEEVLVQLRSMICKRE